MEQKLSAARNKLRDWETRQGFRDLIYQEAVVKLDLQTPSILDGVAKKAKKGRVDAARLVLEVTGRHNPKGDQSPTQVILQVAMPRPQGSPQIIDGEVVEDIREVDGGRPEIEDED